MSAHIIFWVSLLAFFCLRALFLHALKKHHAATYGEVAAHAVEASNLDPRHWLFARFIWSLQFVRLRDSGLTIVGAVLMASEASAAVSFLLIVLH